MRSALAPPSPSPSAWSFRQRLKNDAIYALATLAIEATSRLPRPALLRLGGFLGGVCHAILRAERRAANENVARIFPEWTRTNRAQFVDRCFRTLGTALGETVAQLRTAPPLFSIDAESRALLEKARRHPKGVLFVSAHLGAWERVAVSLVQGGFPLTTLARAPYDPRFQSIYSRLREAHGVGVIYRGDPHAALRMVRTLREGTLLGMPMDLKTSVESIAVPFLGHCASTPVGPARLALRTGAIVLVGTLTLELGTPPTITVTPIPTEGVDEEELTRRLNDEISRRVLAYAEAWPWMHARWS